MHIQLLQDYHLFLGKIEHSVGQQEGELEQVSTRWRQACRMDGVAAAGQGLRSIGKRHADAEGLRMEKREQRQTDEMSATKRYVEEWLSGRK